ncbi:MAG TPA: helix-turn-helix domain-containing protein [Nocardioidaceae bacterium]|nr:helix-turn-helix domain-containing protein [Nocardioidaceae bacterium]
MTQTSRGQRSWPPRGAGQHPDPDMEQKIRRAWASLLDRADAIGDDIALTLLEKDRAWYDSAGPEMRADVRVNTREHVRRGIRTMAGLADEDEKAIHVWRETGRKRARQGVPMELVLNAYSLGTRVLWEALVEQGRNDQVEVDDHVLLTAGQRIWNALDVQNATLVESYRREAARLQRRDLQRQQSFLDGLVEGRGADPAFAAEVRDVLGVSHDEPVACVVAPFDDALEEPLRAPDDRLERAGRVSHWHVRGGASFGLVATGDLTVAGLVDLLAPAAAGRVGVAPSPDGVAGFANAYQLALRAAETVPPGTQQVVAVTDRLPEVLLSGSPEVAALLVAETVGGVLAQPAQQADLLLETLAALLAHNGSPTHAAEDLFCHRNTVIYRMKQIEALTGRSLADPRDRLLLSLALMAAPVAG